MKTALKRFCMKLWCAEVISDADVTLIIHFFGMEGA
jgi:hypothetical protein